MPGPKAGQECFLMQSTGSISDGASASDAVSNAQVFGEMAWLYARSPLHRDMPVRKLEQWALPAISLSQYRLYRRENRPIGFFTWAKLTKQIETKYALDPQSLQPPQWKSGDRIWLIDFIAPFGGAGEIMRDLRTNVFPHDVGRALRPYKNGKGNRVIYFHGIHAVKKARDRQHSPTVELVFRES